MKMLHFVQLLRGHLEHLGTCKAYRAVKIGSGVLSWTKGMGRGNEWWRGRSIDNMDELRLCSICRQQGVVNQHTRYPANCLGKLCQTRGICATVIVVRWHN